MNIAETLKGLVMDSGLMAITWQQAVMIAVACALIYLEIGRASCRERVSRSV